MRIASLLALTSLLLALGSGCALDAGVDESEVGAPALNAASDDPEVEGAVKLQAPPVKLMLTANALPYTALIALRSPVGSYSGMTEHWFGNNLGFTTFASGSSFSLAATPLREESDESIGDWVRPLSESFSCPIEVRPEDWKLGQASFPVDVKPLLFWAVHPDDEREILGLVLGQDERGDFVRAAWYRSSPPDASARAFSAESWVRELHLAVDRNGEPTADPKEIRNTQWYSITMQKPQ